MAGSKKKSAKICSPGTKLVRVRVDATEEIQLKSLLDIEVPLDATDDEIEEAIESASQDPVEFEIVNWDWWNKGTNAFDTVASLIMNHPEEYVAKPDATLVRDASGSLVVKAD